ncbi:ferredoxin [Streptantibioticus cattleyicolor]|uniref:ferredoxin n=1 Tax=Streptomyces sp. SID5468 TaxID=2690295 RepID=UPI00059FE3EC|nr:ferredoxin [Streptantibioticus cattleyicolor]
MRVSVDRDRCCGAGQCVLAVPQVFDQSEEDGLVELLTEEPAVELGPQLHQAASFCPAGAITVHDA